MKRMQAKLGTRPLLCWVPHQVLNAATPSSADISFLNLSVQRLWIVAWTRVCTAQSLRREHSRNALRTPVCSPPRAPVLRYGTVQPSASRLELIIAALGRLREDLGEERRHVGAGKGPVPVAVESPQNRDVVEAERGGLAGVEELGGRLRAGFARAGS